MFTQSVYSITNFGFFYIYFNNLCFILQSYMIIYFNEWKIEFES